MTIEDEIVVLAAKVPREAWDSLPDDLIDRLDFYIYEQEHLPCERQ